jgi:hypothetical protein
MINNIKEKNDLIGLNKKEIIKKEIFSCKIYKEQVQYIYKLNFCSMTNS